MRYVYCIAFWGDEFIMVFNPKRGGWERPGGKVEEGESDLEAVEREFRVEVGHDVEVLVGRKEAPEVTVYAGRIGRRTGVGELRWRTFRELPDRLSFPMVEYLPLIEWGREEIGASYNRDGDGQDS
jgi:8-oxo-dGTP diphosphatase